MRSGIRWMKLPTAPQNVAAGLGKAETVRLWIQIPNDRPHGSKQPPAARGDNACVLRSEHTIRGNLLDECRRVRRAISATISWLSAKTEVAKAMRHGLGAQLPS